MGGFGKRKRKIEMLPLKYNLTKQTNKQMKGKGRSSSSFGGQVGTQKVEDSANLY